MTITIPTGYCQATINYEGDWFASGKGATVLGFNLGTNNLSDVGETLKTQFNTVLAADLYNGITVTTIRVVDAIDGHDTVANITGGTGDAQVPPNVSLLVRKTAIGRGRMNQGRNYWPGLLAKSDLGDNGTLTTPTRNSLQDKFDEFYLNVVEDGLGWVILHNDSEASPADVTGLVVEAKAATQRRRLRV